MSFSFKYLEDNKVQLLKLHKNDKSLCKENLHVKQTLSQQNGNGSLSYKK